MYGALKAGVTARAINTTVGTAIAQWLRCCATNRKVADSIPDGVIEIFHWHNPSDRTMALGSTQPLTEMSVRNISWGKGGRCVGLTTTILCRCHVTGNLNFLEPSVPLQACNGTALPFTQKCILVITYSFNETWIFSTDFWKTFKY